jgi:hypothetical protein
MLLRSGEPPTEREMGWRAMWAHVKKMRMHDREWVWRIYFDILRTPESIHKHTEVVFLSECHECQVKCVWGATHILQCAKYGERIGPNKLEVNGLWKWLKDATETEVEAVTTRVQVAMKQRWKGKNRRPKRMVPEERPKKRPKIVQFPPALVYVGGSRQVEEKPHSMKAIIRKQSTTELVKQLWEQKRKRDEVRAVNEQNKKRKKDGYLEGTFAILEARVQTMGLRTQWVEGDGNCMFRALCMSRYGSDTGHLQLRAQVAPRIEAYRCQLGGENVFDAGREIAQPRVYGWGEALDAVAQEWGMAIHVATGSSEWEGVTINQGATRGTVVIGFIGDHYWGTRTT